MARNIKRCLYRIAFPLAFLAYGNAAPARQNSPNDLETLTNPIQTEIQTNNFDRNTLDSFFDSFSFPKNNRINEISGLYNKAVKSALEKARTRIKVHNISLCSGEYIEKEDFDLEYRYFSEKDKRFHFDILDKISGKDNQLPINLVETIEDDGFEFINYGRAEIKFINPDIYTAVTYKFLINKIYSESNKTGCVNMTVIEEEQKIKKVLF